MRNKVANNIHHIGRIVKNIKAELRYYKYLGFSCREDILIDEYQKVRVGLVEIGQGVLLELLEPLGENSPIVNFLAKGGGLHHICYRTDDFDKKRVALKSLGTILGEPTPSVFDGRRVFFFYSHQHELMEFMESETF